MDNLACTINHPILTPTGYRRADELAIGDKVMIGVTHRLSNFQKEIVRGSLLGDGSLSHTTHKDSAGIRFRLGHGLEQKRFLLWKASLFKNIPHTIYEDKKSIRLDSTPLPELYELRKSMYKNGHKFLTPDFLSALTPLSLAIWYQDDGSLDMPNKKKTNYGRMAICIQAIHPESRGLLQMTLEQKYGINTRIGVVRDKSIMYFDRKNTSKFLQLIHYYVHPSMAYKLLRQYQHKFSVQPQFIEPYLKPIGTPIIRISEKPKTGSMLRFDIRVQNHHNFLADNIIVHNSPETTPGGRALKFYASVRIDVRRIAYVKKGEEIVGSRVRAKVAKNKVASPFKQAEFDIMYGEGISYEGDVLNAAVNAGAVSKSGASYSFNGEKIGNGFDNLKTKLKEDKKLLNELKKKTMELLSAKS